MVMIMIIQTCQEWLTKLRPLCFHKPETKHNAELVNKTRAILYNEIIDDLLVYKAKRYNTTYDRLRAIMNVPGMHSIILEDHFLQGGQFDDDSVFSFADLSPVV